MSQPLELNLSPHDSFNNENQNPAFFGLFENSTASAENFNNSNNLTSINQFDNNDNNAQSNISTTSKDSEKGNSTSGKISQQSNKVKCEHTCGCRNDNKTCKLEINTLMNKNSLKNHQHSVTIHPICTATCPGYKHFGLYFNQSNLKNSKSERIKKQIEKRKEWEKELEEEHKKYTQLVNLLGLNNKDSETNSEELSGSALISLEHKDNNNHNMDIEIIESNVKPLDSSTNVKKRKYKEPEQTRNSVIKLENLETRTHYFAIPMLEKSPLFSALHLHKNSEKTKLALEQLSNQPINLTNSDTVNILQQVFTNGQGYYATFKEHSAIDRLHKDIMKSTTLRKPVPQITLLQLHKTTDFNDMEIHTFIPEFKKQDVKVNQSNEANLNTSTDIVIPVRFRSKILPLSSTKSNFQLAKPEPLKILEVINEEKQAVEYFLMAEDKISATVDKS
jgi:hypothetical protein